MVGSIEKWGEHMRFYLPRYSVVVCHKLKHLNPRVYTLDFIWNCWRLLEAKRFLRNHRQFKWFTRETRYHVSITKLLKGNLMSRTAELFWRPRTILKILYFSGDYQFFQKSLEIKFFDQGRNLFHSLAWEA